jgi:hypothetical protein
MFFDSNTPSDFMISYRILLLLEYDCLGVAHKINLPKYEIDRIYGDRLVQNRKYYSISNPNNRSILFLYMVTMFIIR